jgi:hypothetical protein
LAFILFVSIHLIIHTFFLSLCSSGCADGMDVVEQPHVEGVQQWSQILQRAWREDEEHNIKLVYVCRELWRRYGRWRGFRAAAEAFTPTPGIGPDASAAFSA